MSENNPQDPDRPSGPPAFGQGRASTFNVGSAPAAIHDGGGGAKIPILFGAIVALAGASIYGFMQISELKTDLAETRELLAGEIGKVTETTTDTSKTSRASVAALKLELEEARRQAAQLAGQAKVEATRNIDALAEKLEDAKLQQSAQTAKVAESVNIVDAKVAAVKEDTNANREKVTAVSTEVSAVRTQADATKAELQKTIADLSSTRGDLGVQSGLIATNSKELSALRQLGERNYTEFRVAKIKTMQRVGDLQVRLTKADPKKNRYTIEVMVDDKLIEKKDKTANEPVQFMLPRAAMPFELVVNEVKKDMIVGYLASPKVQVTRN
ncbi:MAG: hypothetical protein ABI811_20745 [Acidobacteriota bacterium]